VSREGETPLGRWARLKAEARAAEREAEIAQEAPPPPVAVEPPPPEKPGEEAKPVELPPIESLTKDSDFSLFMRGGVPDGARTAALRKLWSVDSHFAQIDISECHSIDFNAVPTFPEGLKNTIYRAGKGMVEAVEEIERAEREAAEKARLARAPSDSPAAAPENPPAPGDPAPPTDKA
jgi:hypothetical protein